MKNYISLLALVMNQAIRAVKLKVPDCGITDELINDLFEQTIEGQTLTPEQTS